MYETVDDLAVTWTLNGPALARRVLAHADTLEERGQPADAEELRALIRCDYDPLPPVRPQLGAPPTLRPAVPPRQDPGA